MNSQETETQGTEATKVEGSDEEQANNQHLSTFSSDDYDMKDVDESNHAARIKKLHQQRIQNYLK